VRLNLGAAHDIFGTGRLQSKPESDPLCTGFGVVCVTKESTLIGVVQLATLMIVLGAAARLSRLIPRNWNL